MLSRVISRSKFRVNLYLITDTFEMLIFGMISYPFRGLLVILFQIFSLGATAVVLSIASLTFIFVVSYDAFWSMDVLFYNQLLSAFAFISILTMILAKEPSKSIQQFSSGSHKLVEKLLIISFAASFIQGLWPEFWQQLIPNATFLPLRGPGFQSEPSYLSSIILLYYIQALSVKGKHSILAKALIFPIGIFLTKSLSVALVAPIYYLYLYRRLGKVPIISLAPIGLYLGLLFFSERLSGLDFQGDIFHSITLGVTSWRNIPDISILTDFGSFLFPSTDHREALLRAVYQQFFLTWVTFSFSNFSTWVLSFGAIAVFPFILFLIYRVMTVHNLIQSRSVRLYLLFYCLFFVVKFDPLGWIIIGIICQREMSIVHDGDAYGTLQAANDQLGKRSVSTSPQNAGL